MSATICWQPVNPAKHYLVVGPKSRFIGMMNEAFGEHPWTLEPHDRDRLEGMRLGAGDKSVKEALSVLMQALDNHGGVKVWAEY